MIGNQAKFSDGTYEERWYEGNCRKTNSIIKKNEGKKLILYSNVRHKLKGRYPRRAGLPKEDGELT